MNKQRLQELAGITELGINKPLTKVEIIEQIGEFNSDLFWSLIKNKDINNLISGFHSLNEFLDEEWGYEEKLEEAANLIINYYKYIQPGEISTIDDDVIKNDIQGFKNLWNYSYEDEVIIFVTKF